MKHHPDKDWTLNNRKSIEQSDKDHQCGCTVCNEFFLASEVIDFGGPTGQNGECPLCGNDSVIAEKDFGSDRIAFQCAVMPPELVPLATTQITVKESNIYTGELSIYRRYDVNDSTRKCELYNEYISRGIHEDIVLDKLSNLPFPPVFLLKVVKKDYLYSHYDKTIETATPPFFRYSSNIINSRDKELLDALHYKGGGIDRNTTEVTQAFNRLHKLYLKSKKDLPSPSHYVFDRNITGELYAVGTEHTSTQSTESFESAQQTAKKYYEVDKSDWKLC